MHRLYIQLWQVMPHLTAATVALTYAWFVSQTPLHKSGLQFMAPIALIIMVHLIWFTMQGRLQAGFANRIYAKAIATAAFMAAALMAGSLFAPKPAFAVGQDSAEVILMVMFCAAIVAIVVLIGAALIYLAFVILRALVRAVTSASGSDDDRPQSRFFDIGSLILCGAVIGLASLEGLPQGYAFGKKGRATATRLIAADDAAVWDAMQTATSPEFALPAALDLFPQPIAVSVDEGVALGANRVVEFAGREGAGALHLQVVEATATSVVFAVLSDTTPYAGWIRYRGLRYDVVPKGDATELSVSLAFERKLAPAWFFDPLMQRASYLAMDVLARDVKIRSELLS